jgi:hypothetical protein
VDKKLALFFSCAFGKCLAAASAWYGWFLVAGWSFIARLKGLGLDSLKNLANQHAFSQNINTIKKNTAGNQV